MTGQQQETRFSANLSILFPDLPFLERPAAAASRGFKFVESWWPFQTSSPSTEQIDSFYTALQEAEVSLVSINLFEGTPSEGDRGILSLPQEGQRFEESLDAIVQILDATGCQEVNALYGNRVEEISESEQQRIGLERLVQVANTVAPLGAEVLIETLNSVDSPNFPLIEIETAATLVEQARLQSLVGNVALLFDVYHLASMGNDVVQTLKNYRPLIGHVQLADFPGRGIPGSGDIDFHSLLKELQTSGYEKYVGLEFIPQNFAFSQSFAQNLTQH